MTTHDAAWDEDRGGNQGPDNLLSFPSDGEFYKATKKAIPWMECGAHDAHRMVINSIFIEQLFRRAPVDNPASLDTYRVMTKCLGVDEYLGDALDLLITEGLLMRVDEDGNECDDKYEFLDPYHLLARADKLVTRCRDDPVLLVTDSSFEWLEGYTNTSEEEKNIGWFEKLSFADVTKLTEDLSVYIALGLVLGQRSTQAVRVDPNGCFYNMVGHANGGQLAHAVKTFYLQNTDSNAPAVAPAFLLEKIASFFVDTEWPEHYALESTHLINYAYDLPARTAWKTATRSQWVGLVQSEMARAVTHFDTLEMIFRDHLRRPADIARDFQSIGDLALDGDGANKLPFWRIADVEAELKKDYGEFIESERDGGTDTSDIVGKLLEKLRAKATRSPRRQRGAQEATPTLTAGPSRGSWRGRSPRRQRCGSRTSTSPSWRRRAVPSRRSSRRSKMASRPSPYCRRRCSSRPRGPAWPSMWGREAPTSSPCCTRNATYSICTPCSRWRTTRTRGRCLRRCAR